MMPSVFQSLQDMDEQRVKMIQVQTICYDVDRIIAHQTFLEFHAEVSSNGAGRSSYCWSMPRGYSKVYRLNQWKRGETILLKRPTMIHIFLLARPQWLSKLKMCLLASDHWAEGAWARILIPRHNCLRYFPPELSHASSCYFLISLQDFPRW